MVTTFVPAYLIINSACRDRKEHKDRDSESRVKKCGRQMHGWIERRQVALPAFQKQTGFIVLCVWEPLNTSFKSN